MSRLADDQMIPAIEWFAEQMPGGFIRQTGGRTAICRAAGNGVI